MSTVPQSAFGKLGAVMKGAGGPVARSPLGRLAMGAVGMVGAPLVAQMGVMAGKKVSDAITDRPYWQAHGYQQEMRRQEIIRMEQERRLKEAVARNTMLLAQTDPQLFAELSSGRRLPKGAVPIGGKPRSDIIAEVARRMATGELAGGGQGGIDGLLQ